MKETQHTSILPRDLKASENLSRASETDDDSLILWMRSLTPIQRLEVAQGFVDSVMALRDASLQ